MTAASARAEAFAAAAESLVGIPFRLHGRCPSIGLDCVGVIACALEKAGGAPVAPQFYQLRNRDISAFIACAAASGFMAAQGTPRRGDLLLLKPGPAQSHLACVTAHGRILHAHAGLGRVVEQPLPTDWTQAAHWRLASGTSEI